MNPSITQLPARMRDRLRELSDAARGDADGRAVELEISTDPSDAPADVREECGAEVQEIVARWTGR